MFLKLKLYYQRAKVGLVAVRVGQCVAVVAGIGIGMEQGAIRTSAKVFRFQPGEIQKAAKGKVSKNETSVAQDDITGGLSCLCQLFS